MRGQMRLGAVVAATAVAALGAVTAGVVAADHLSTRIGHGNVVAAHSVENPASETDKPPSPIAALPMTPSPTHSLSPVPRPTTPASRSAIATSTAPASTGPVATAQHNADAAVRYAAGRGYRLAVAVLDTKTGQLITAGDAEEVYASESVVKTFIATRLLVTGQMTGWVADTAWKMITQSDDASANTLYGLAGGDGVVTWAAMHYGIPDLGSPPPRAGWWGGTRITAAGLVRFYAAVQRDETVGRWLLNAMHHAAPHGSDGFDQRFGIASATTGAAVKQGWGFDFGDGSACLNSTGLVDGDRYAVAMLVRGPAGSYPAAISTVLTEAARTLMPAGHIPSYA